MSKLCILDSILEGHVAEQIAIDCKCEGADEAAKERHCQKCLYRNGLLCPYIEICDAAYRRGFIKGYRYHRDINK